MILVDGRWTGHHGIARFSREIISRLENVEIFTQGPQPLSLRNLYWLPKKINQHRKKAKIFFTPGFNPPIRSAIPFVFTLYDLIHIHIQEETSYLKRQYYENIIKPAIEKARCVFTVSEFSKHSIINWAQCEPDKIQVTPVSVSDFFKEAGHSFIAGYPYLLYVGNDKAHKNLFRLLKAFKIAFKNDFLYLILIIKNNQNIKKMIQALDVPRCVVVDNIDDETLATYYRGALGFVMPSLYEGFGLPVLEAMACGTPVLTSQVTSLPEVAKEAALLIDPYDVEELAVGMQKLIFDDELRKNLKKKGLERVKKFSWDASAKKIQYLLKGID